MEKEDEALAEELNSSSKEEGLLFADATTDYQSAHFVILGVPFDGTSTHRKGSEYAC